MFVSNSITITELLKKHKEIINMLDKAKGPIPVISNSRVVFYISKDEPQFNSKLEQAPLKRHKFSLGIDKHISSKDLYD